MSDNISKRGGSRKGAGRKPGSTGENSRTALLPQCRVTDAERAEVIRRANADGLTTSEHMRNILLAK